MYDNMQRSGRVYDFEAHTELIKRRSVPFIGLWLLLGIFSIIAIIPFFWVICAVFAVYFVLIFQVFTFEPELSPIGCVKKSLILIKGKFVPTFLLLASVGILTYYLIPELINIIFDGIGLNLLLSNLILPLIKALPELDLSAYGLSSITHNSIAAIFIKILIAQIIIQYTLPLRSVLWSVWYKELNNGIKPPELPKKTRKSSKRPSEKLMEASHKKFSKKKIDENILKRAYEKDEGE